MSWWGWGWGGIDSMIVVMGTGTYWIDIKKGEPRKKAQISELDREMWHCF